MKMKGRLSLMAAALICGLMFTTCDLFKDEAKEPEVKLKSVDFTGIDFTGLTLLSKLDVKNNISIDIPFPKIDWDLLVISRPFVDGVIQSEGFLKSKESTEVQFPVNFTYANLISAITGLNDDNARYKINMIAHIPVPGLRDLSWPFEHEGKIPLLRVPDITVAAAPKATINYSGIIPTGSIDFALNVKNNSNVDVTVNELSYDFKVNSASLSKGEIPGKPRINPGNTEKITVNFPMTASEIVTVGIGAITGNFNYILTGNYKFGIPEFPLLNEVGDSFTLP
jgi:LEA14-like dessication related protein